MILGLNAEATEAEIKSAYRKLAKAFHPDRGGNPEIFNKVQRAYETLINPLSRKTYDRSGVVQDTSYWHNVKVVAREKLNELLEGLLMHMGNPDTTDVMKLLRSQVEKGPREMDRMEAETQTEIAKIRRIQKRFKIKKGKKPSPLVTEFFNKKIPPLEEKLKQIQMMRDVNSEVGKMLEGWEYQYDVPPSGYQTFERVIIRSGSPPVKF